MYEGPSPWRLRFVHWEDSSRVMLAMPWRLAYAEGGVCLMDEADHQQGGTAFDFGDILAAFRRGAARYY